MSGCSAGRTGAPAGAACVRGAAVPAPAPGAAGAATAWLVAGGEVRAVARSSTGLVPFDAAEACDCPPSVRDDSTGTVGLVVTGVVDCWSAGRTGCAGAVGAADAADCGAGGMGRVVLGDSVASRSAAARCVSGAGIGWVREAVAAAGDASPAVPPRGMSVRGRSSPRSGESARARASPRSGASARNRASPRSDPADPLPGRGGGTAVAGSRCDGAAFVDVVADAAGAAMRASGC